MEDLMKKLFLALFVLVLFIGCKSTPEEAAPVEPETQAEEAAPVVDASTHYNRGMEHYNKYEFDQAIGEFNEAANKDPKMADALIARGNAYSGKIQLEQALDDYTAAAKVNAGYDHYAKGYSRFLYEDYRAAITEFSLAIDEKSNLLAAYNDRGLAYTNLGNYDQAMADFNEAININPNSAFAYNNRGNVYLMKKNYDKAIEDYTKASEIYPELVFPHSGKGFVHHQKKEYDLAIEDYNKAMELAPENATIYTLRGNTYSAMKQKDLADADFARASELKK